MKRFFYLILAVISCVVLATALTGASSKGEKFNLKLDANERTIEALKNNPVTTNNNRKFEGKESESQMHLNLTLDNNVNRVNDLFSTVPVDASGNLILDKAYPFKGSGEMNLLSFNGREIYYGRIEINMNHANGEDKGIISIRYEPSSGKIDATLTSGDIEDIAVIPFGQPFLTDADLDNIDSILSTGTLKD
ncbi:hypothetical protein J23TS9_42470 [Paenibacillus sp. J23TS9]|uniref:hypothetical protein n=1 Tax=Paenibacillus sp. J23TS9 TaxID=2807193 RepID=UPI001B2ED3E5|nr:hypothetical protein [Paenibacillus sp. J23TS9]GIP29117.1 hypothetical protein J23TS9_42470 [Paenibacillus sp. J23TS9]